MPAKHASKEEKHMNETAKRIRELNAQIAQKSAEAQSLLSGEGKDVNKAAACLDEAEALEKEKSCLERIQKQEKSAVSDAADKTGADQAEKAFADAARKGFKVDKTMNEGTPADGGYTVPEDIRTRVEQYRDAKFSLRSLVNVETTKTKSGRRTFQKRAQQSAFTKVGEGGKIGRRIAPQFEIQEYTIEKYGGYLPVTNELLADSDANITSIMIKWLGDASRVTDNVLILNELNKKDQTIFTSLEDLKYAVIVGLGQAFADTCCILTNDDGLLWMDTLKDNDGKSLLKDAPTDTLPRYFSIGGRHIPVRVIPNADMPSGAEYAAAEDTTVKAGTTYYTRTGAGTDASPYVYEEVETPTGNPKTSGYYVVTGMLVPMMPGDFREAVTIYDRQSMQLKLSDVAVVGSGDDQLNAYEDDLTVIRALLRMDVRTRDDAAYVNGRIRMTV